MSWKIAEAIGPFNSFCDGYGAPEAAGKNYITVLNLAIGKTLQGKNPQGSNVLDAIVAFDRAEVNEAYIGQTNMITVSSFCGIKGRIWGLEIFPYEEYKYRENFALFARDGVPVYDINPVLEASKALFGTLDKKIFPLIPGGHVPCALKYITNIGPSYIYAAIGVGIPEDRGKNACLFMEDMGKIKAVDTIESIANAKKDIASRLADSIIQVGKNQRIEYKEIYIGVKEGFIQEGEVGCALAAVPYITLARNAVNAKVLENFDRLTLEDWQKEINPNV